MTKEEELNNYIDTIIKFAKYRPDTEENAKELAELITKYAKYCYDHNIEDYNKEAREKGYGDIENLSFIIESKPEFYELDEKEVSDAWNHLLEVLDNGGGISKEEADLLLKWSIEKARNVLGRSRGLMNNSLTGACGYSQMLTLAAFLKAGVKTTLNNTSYFVKNGPRHAFGTITLPIETNGIVEEKQFLLDATYRQFFTTLRCNEGRYYSARLLGSTGPDSGYYMINYLDGKKIATEILKKGYIELTPEVLTKYASSFIAERLNITNKDNIYEIYKNIKYEDLLRVLNEKQEELEYDEEEIEEALEKVDFPKSSYTL